MNVCAVCKAPVMWLRNPKTRKMAPIDKDPVPGGNIVIDLDEGEYEVRPGLTVGYVSHFVTCPEANRFRGGH